RHTVVLSARRLSSDSVFVDCPPHVRVRATRGARRVGGLRVGSVLRSGVGSLPPSVHPSRACRGESPRLARSAPASRLMGSVLGRRASHSAAHCVVWTIQL